MNALESLIGSFTAKATDAASAAAEAKASQIYEQNKPLVYAAAFMVVTVYLFYFLPRFALPWARRSVQ